MKPEFGTRRITIVRFPTRRSAQEEMIRIFRDVQVAYTSSVDLMCVDLMCLDATPVGEWHDTASPRDVDILMRTPIRPPVEEIAVGIVTKPYEGGFRLILVSVVRLADGIEIREVLPTDVIDPRDNPAMRINCDAVGLAVSQSPLLREDGVSLYPIPDAFTIEVVLCSLAMFHVKNIGHRAVPFPRHMRRAAIKQGLPGPTVYHTLTVRPFRANVGDSKETRTPAGQEQPLHLVRGHFARYTTDGPLFGKYVGTFWRPEHEAGNPAIAVIRKTYKIEP